MRGTAQYPGDNAGASTTTVPHILLPTKTRIRNSHGAYSSLSSSHSPEAPAASGPGEQCSYSPSCLSSSAISRSNPHNACAESTPTECPNKTRYHEIALKCIHFGTSNIPFLELPDPAENITTGTKLSLVRSFDRAAEHILLADEVMIMTISSTCPIGFPAGAVL